MACKRHGGDGGPGATCYGCRAEAAVSNILLELAEDDPSWRNILGVGTTPRYRYWRIKRAKGRSERTFEYTTETADEGKYWAVERRWVRVKGGERGKIIRKVGFKMRRKAKERAYEWYTKAQTPAPTEA
jgi:hypothetical protein